MLQGCPVTCENQGSPSVSCSNPTTSPSLPQQNTSQLGNFSMKPGKLRSRFLRAFVFQRTYDKDKFLGFYSRGLCVPTSNFRIKRGRKFVTSRKTWAYTQDKTRSQAIARKIFLPCPWAPFHGRTVATVRPQCFSCHANEKEPGREHAFFHPAAFLVRPRSSRNLPIGKTTNVTQVQSNCSTLSYSAAQLSSTLLSGWTKVRISEVFQLNFRR